MKTTSELPLATSSMPTRAVTARDVAARAGVHQSSVSVVLNGAKSNTGVSDDARQRILAAAAELGYRPNGSARAMRSRRFGTLALLVPTNEHSSALFKNLQAGIHDAMNERDLHLMMARLPDEKLTDTCFVPKFLREWMADGLLISYAAAIPPQLQQIVRQNNLPAMWINSNQPQDCVRPDDLAAGFQATQHLIELGHRQILFLAHNTDHYSLQERRTGYEMAMSKAGLCPHVLHEVIDRGDWVARLQDLFKTSPRPTAAIAYDTFTAHPALFAALTAGLQVPRDFSLVSFYEEQLVDHSTGISISTWQLPEYSMGRKAVETLLQKIEHPAEQLPPCILPLTFLEGATCAPAP